MLQAKRKIGKQGGNLAVKRYLRTVIAFLLVVLVLFSIGSVLYCKKTSSYHIGSLAARGIENCTGSVITLIDDFLENANADTEHRITTLEAIETYVDHCIADLSYFQNVVNRIGSAQSVKSLFGNTAHGIEVSYICGDMYVFKVFVRRCINAEMKNENADTVKVYLAEAKDEIKKIQDAFANSDFSQCKGSRDFYKKYERLIREAWFTNLFENFSSYLK